MRGYINSTRSINYFHIRWQRCLSIIRMWIDKIGSYIYWFRSTIDRIECNIYTILFRTRGRRHNKDLSIYKLILYLLEWNISFSFTQWLYIFFILFFLDNSTALHNNTLKLGKTKCFRIEWKIICLPNFTVVEKKYIYIFNRKKEKFLFSLV